MSDVYIVHGWKIPPQGIRQAIAEKGLDVKDAGLSVVLAKGGHAFLGEILAKLSEGDVFVGHATPGSEDVERLKGAARTAGIDRVLGPEIRLWFVVG